MSLLDEKRKEYGIPDAPYSPKGKVCLVYRLPPETRTAGGLVIIETSQEPKPIGILIAAAALARCSAR